MATIAVEKPTRSKRRHQPFTVPHFRNWAESMILDNEEPWVVEDYFEEFLVDVFTGIPICWLVVPEENAKTTSAAGLALYHIEHRVSGYVPVAASSREQAEWIYRQAEGFVYRSELRGTFKCLEGYRRIRCDGMGSRIQVFAADDRSGDGIIPTLAILEELHRHRDLALYRTWCGKLRKRGAQIIVLSTAGEVGGEFEAERETLRQATEVTRRRAFVRAERRLGEKPLSVLHEWAIPEGGDSEDLALVKAANPFSGVTTETLREKRAMTHSTEHWARFTCNRPTRSESSAIQEAEWFAAATKERIPEGEPVWLGLDVAWKWDTTAAVPLWIRDAEFRLLGPAAVLEPPRDGTSLDPYKVEQALTHIHDRNPVHTVVMDMSKAEQLASWIESELGARVIDRSQTNPLAALDYDRFMEALRHGWLKHAGDEALTRHALNAIARVLPQGDARFDRPSQSRRHSGEHDRRVIDALTAASMVHTTAAAELTAEPETGSWRLV